MEQLGGGGAGSAGLGAGSINVCVWAAGLRRGRRQGLAWNQMCRGAALAATGAARSHARAGAHMAWLGGGGWRAGPGTPRISDRPQTCACGGETPAQQASAPPRWESHPRDGWGPPRLSVPSPGRERWLLRNLPPLLAPPLSPPHKGLGTLPRPPKFVFLSLCVRFFKVLSQSFP